MDPITVTAAISAASSAVGYIKKSVQMGREMQDCVGQLSQWASAMSDLTHLEQKHKTNNIPWWKKMSGSVEAEALAVFRGQNKS